MLFEILKLSQHVPREKILKASSSKCKICDTHTDKYTSLNVHIHKHTHERPYKNTPTKKKKQKKNISMKIVEQVTTFGKSPKESGFVHVQERVLSKPASS